MSISNQLLKHTDHLNDNLALMWDVEKDPVREIQPRFAGYMCSECKQIYKSPLIGDFVCELCMVVEE